MNVLMRRLCLQHGMTSLIWASGRGHSEIAAALLNAGANPNAADKVSELTVGIPRSPLPGASIYTVSVSQPMPRLSYF